MQSITEQITATLGGLGQNHVDIANALRAKGIKGARATSDICPLAMYLHEQFPEITLQVGCYGVTYYDGDGEPVEPVSLSDGQRDFVHAFDHGYFPDLEG